MKKNCPYKPYLKRGAVLLALLGVAGGAYLMTRPRKRKRKAALW